MVDIDVSLARADERDVVANLFQFYIHDFSEFWFDRAEGELQPDGRFAPYPLDPWWRGDADCLPLLIRADGHLAGFALLNAASHSGRPLDRNMAEFFIVRKHRRGGVGTRAARTLFERYPGVWEAAVVRRNVAALGFWRRAIEGHALAENVEQLDVQTDHWNGPILRFTARAPG
jgi:predicted acetyltransferase